MGDNQSAQIDYLANTVEVLAVENERLREENARLREALKPFAEKEYAYEGWADIARAEVWLNVRDIRAAAAAILGDVKAEAACPEPDEAP
jgi:hypothetical protein